MSVGTGVEQQLQAKLVELQSSLMDVAGVLVASSDGLAMAHTMPGGIDSNRVAAMAATAAAEAFRKLRRLMGWFMVELFTWFHGEAVGTIQAS